MKNRKDKELERLLANAMPIKDLAYFKGKLVSAKLMYNLTDYVNDKQQVDHYAGIIYQIESRIF